MSRIYEARQSLQNTIWLIERKEIVLWMSDESRRELLSMLRFYFFCVTKGVTPEASAIAAIEFVNSIKSLQ